MFTPVDANFWMCRQGLGWGRAPLLLSCSAPLPVARLLIFAELVDELMQGLESVRWIPGPYGVCETHDLAFAHRSKIPAVEGVRIGLDDKELTLEEPHASLPEGQRKAVTAAVERLGNDLAIDENDPVGPADFIATDRDHTLEKRYAEGQQATVREQVCDCCRGPDHGHVAP